MYSFLSCKMWPLSLFYFICGGTGQQVGSEVLNVPARQAPCLGTADVLVNVTGMNSCLTARRV